MTDADSAGILDAVGSPTLARPPDRLVRFFGWSMLALLVAYLCNRILAIHFDWAGPVSVFKGSVSSGALIQWAVLAAATAFGWWRSGLHSTLREDSARISAFNAWLIRGFFWSVLLVGLADMAISFMRVENMLETALGNELARDLGRPQFRGSYVHLPLIGFSFLIASITRTLGFHWLALLIVVAELAIVFTRFVFSYEQAFMGDLVRFWYAALFLFASAYTLLEDGHVRVDILYSSMSRATKGLFDSIGAILLGMTLCWTILLVGFAGRSSIIYGPLHNFEVSQSGFGLYVKYLMAGFLGVFAITMLIQFIAQLFQSVADWRNLPGGADHSGPVAH